MVLMALVRGGHITAPGIVDAVASPHDVYRRQCRVGLLHRCWALLILLVGIVEPVSGPAAAAQVFWRNLHPVYGCMLLGFVVSRLYWNLAVPVGQRLLNQRGFSRQLGLNVYLLLYLTIFLRQVMELICVIWQACRSGLGSLGSYWQAPADQVIEAFKQDFGGYVVGGVLSIVLIRAFTIAYYLREDAVAGTRTDRSDSN